MSKFRYTACGLDNVFIEGLDVFVEDAGEAVYSIPNINGLHRIIAYCIVTHDHGITPAELRFLRTEMGLTQSQLADRLHMDRQTVGRWERGEMVIDQRAEALIRGMAAEMLGLKVDLTLEELTARCVPGAEIQIIGIDGSDPSDYRPVPKAA